MENVSLWSLQTFINMYIIYIYIYIYTCNIYTCNRLCVYRSLQNPVCLVRQVPGFQSSFSKLLSPVLNAYTYMSERAVLNPVRLYTSVIAIPTSSVYLVFVWLILLLSAVYLNLNYWHIYFWTFGKKRMLICQAQGTFNNCCWRENEKILTHYFTKPCEKFPSITLTNYSFPLLTVFKSEYNIFLQVVITVVRRAESAGPAERERELCQMFLNVVIFLNSSQFFPSPRLQKKSSDCPASGTLLFSFPLKHH